MRQKKYLSVIIPLVLILATVCFLLFFKIIIVHGESMSPNLKNGQIVLLKRNVEYNDLHIGDLVVFKSKEYGTCIKRIAALSGDSISQNDNELYINGALKFQYSTDVVAEYQINDNEIYVLGDNFYGSTDSRDFGPIDYSDVVGKIVIPSN